MSDKDKKTLLERAENVQTVFKNYMKHFGSNFKAIGFPAHTILHLNNDVDVTRVAKLDHVDGFKSIQAIENIIHPIWEYNTTDELGKATISSMKKEFEKTLTPQIKQLERHLEIVLKEVFEKGTSAQEMKEKAFTNRELTQYSLREVNP